MSIPFKEMSLRSPASFSYEGNPNLCEAPLPKKCLGEEIAQNPAMNRSREHVGMQDEKKKGLYP